MSTFFRMLLVNRASSSRATSTHLKFHVNYLPKRSLLVASRCSECRCKAFQHQRTSYNAQTSLRAISSSNDNGKQVIYTGLLCSNIRRIKLFSLSTSIIGLAVQPVVYQKALLAGTTTKFTLPAFALIGLLALATPPLLHIITKRYVLSVEYDATKDMYTATTYNLLCIRKKIEFTPEDVTIPTVLGMFTTCAIRGKPVFLDAKSFTDQSHYKRIMGYDKPVDLLVDKDVNSNENCSKKIN
ncbi:transmembrane protein 70 homolog, mitochondrial [Nasonia vitripennis]|uniref:Transmembrane protein 70 homolog, mitochondrial n=1 Tax=Nasonia vitripennis TaxID=7425 RepID=A0A7M7GE93_NASVI|nr:transmembrane protein 70 homolog, mitochondrial [Nasonia vitripennis]